MKHGGDEREKVLSCGEETHRLACERIGGSNVVNVIEGWTRPVRPNKELHTQFIRTHYGNYL